MIQADRLAHLDNALAALEAAMGWLSRSSQRCRDIDPAGPLAEADFDALENLTSRFARVVDLLIHKVYRAMDAVELDEAARRARAFRKNYPADHPA